jgi:hypothetical protein
MASRKDLAGLAALGALGYMLSRDKNADVDTSNVGDVDLTGGARAQRERDMSDMGDSSNTTGQYAPGPSNMMRREPVAKPRPSPRPTTRPVTPMTGTGSGGGRGPAFGEAEAYRQRQFEEANARANSPEGRAERARMEQAQALEAVRPEEAMIGGGGLKTVAAMARGLARRPAKLNEYIRPELTYAEKQLLQNNPTRQITGPSKADLVARDRAARAAGREAERQEFNKRGLDRFVESTFEGGMKRGGKVKKMASGGMARSSASKRGDGIATKGKTKGRIY